MSEPEANIPPRTRRRRIVLLAILAALLVVLLSLRWVSQPAQVGGLVLDRVGRALDLEISASGTTEYRLRGTPTLVVRGLVARRPGADTPLLTAARVQLSLPWSTIESRGADLVITRVELDAPQLDLAELQAWRVTRPPAAPRVPTLTDGLHVVDGRIIGAGWSIEALDFALPSLHPRRPVAARLGGHYRDGEIRVPFDLDAALTEPDAHAGLGATGTITVETPDWQLPMQATLSARLHDDDDGIGLDCLRFGARARHVTDDVETQFVFGIGGTLRYHEDALSIAPLAIVLRGEGVMPELAASGGLSLHESLALRLDGTLAQWPRDWPALPPPLDQSAAPLPFALGYRGDTDVSGVTTLQLQRDDTRFDGRFRLPELLEWLDAIASGTPLPPLDGTLHSPRLEVPGAVLEGVEVEIGDQAE